MSRQTGVVSHHRNANPAVAVRHELRRIACSLALIVTGCNAADWSSTVADSDATLLHHAAPGMALVAEGHRDQTHLLLDERAKLEVLAHWSPVGHGRAFESGHFPFPFYEPFRQLRVAQPTRVYTNRHFSVFLPREPRLDSVGAMWSLDPHGVSQFLTQFHPAVSMHIDSTGRLAGPDGGFAILRAVGKTHAEIVFRIHAEIEPEQGVFFTPAHFSGSLLVNKQLGTVEHFRLGIPTEGGLNATLTVALPTEALLDIVHVDQMELISADSGQRLEIDWTDEIELYDAEVRLKKLFYDFLEIDWVPAEDALALAEAQQRPIFAVVLWGGLDQQSC